MRCFVCSPTPRKKNSDIYLIFAIIKDEKKKFYAFKQVNNTLTLLRSNGNEPEFAKAIVNDSSLRMEVPIFSRMLKNRGEDYKDFIRRIANIKTKQFVEGLKKHYRDPTRAEKVIDFMKSLVPFYTCIKNIKSGYQGGAVISCSLDILSLLPIAGFTAKYSSIIWRSLINDIGQQTLQRLSQSTFNKLAISASLDQIYKTVTRTLVREVLTKRLVKDITIASLRTFDPGFELSFQFLKFSKKILGKMMKNLQLYFRSHTKVKNLLLSIESTLKIIQRNVNRNVKLVTDNTGLIPSVIYKEDNYKIIRYLYPNGLNYFGPKCISAFGITAELRTIEGHLFQSPVVPIESNGKLSYRELNPKSGEIYDNELLIAEDGILRKNENYVDLPELNENGVLGNFYKTEDSIIWKNGVRYCKRKRLKRTGRTNLNENVEINAEQCIPIPIDPDIPGTSRQSIQSDDIPGTSREANNRLFSTNYIHQQDMAKTKNLLNTFKEKGLKGLKDENNLLTLRKIVSSLDSYQTSQKVLKPPEDLWFTETLTRPSIVEFLKNLKGEDFYFNDITLLSAVDLDDIIPKKKIKYALKTEVRYHIKINSQYGIVDLSAIDKNFQNQYIIFPEVEYFVTNTEYFNGKEILVLHLQQRKMTKEDWIKITQGSNKLLDGKELLQTKRGDLIENAAFYVSANKPLNRFTKTEETLRKFILKIDDTVNSVPTYDTLAKNIYSDNIIPVQFNEWKVMYNKYTNDVLFQNELHHVNDLTTAKNTINHVFNGIYGQPVEPVFNTYHKYSKIRDLVRFEDYYTIYSFLSFNLVSNINAAARVAASVRRLALRQCDKRLNQDPITMYFAHNLSRNKFEELIRMRTGGDYHFREMQQFHWSRESTLKSFPHKLPTDTFVMYEVTLSNKAGLADLTAIIFDPNVHYYVPEELKLKIVSRSKETIQGRDVFIVKLEDDKVPTEKRMVNLVNKINSVLSKRNNFYVNM
ncbi:uncharacterized protein LOC122512858 [Leptopilina heterotoma]|uniref:uncharacterized protein LOC122512858 n=1 Tax=Leptopilina heterotoma TaxID=63436 RepID=UPI001CA9B9ED|nr:uncharacterized protein LOC122512858 [Leptopilina heterotoma]